MATCSMFLCPGNWMCQSKYKSHVSSDLYCCFLSFLFLLVPPTPLFLALLSFLSTFPLTSVADTLF